MDYSMVFKKTTLAVESRPGKSSNGKIPVPAWCDRNHPSEWKTYDTSFNTLFRNMILIIRLHECHQEPPPLIPDNFVALKLFFMYIPHLFSIKKSFENVSTNYTATCKHHRSRRVPGCFLMEPERRPDGRQFFIFRTNTVRR